MNRFLSAAAISFLLVSSVACHTDGDELIRVVDEPPGERCAAGGVAVHMGIDDDGDGILDVEEIDETTYSCDDARETISRVDEEPAGDHCPMGGAAVHSGADVDADGRLDDWEISATHYVCERVYVGDYTIASRADADAFAGIEVITGTLAIDALDGEIALALVHVGRDLTVRGAQPGAALALPALASIDGDLDVDAALDGLALDALASVAGDVRLRSLDAGTVDLRALGAVGGSAVAVVENPGLQYLYAQALSEVGGASIEIRDNPALRGIALEGLTRANDVRIDGNDAVSKIDISSLTEVSGDLLVADAGDLASLDLAALEVVGGDMTVAGHANLVAVDLAALETVDGAFHVSSCPALALELPALRSASGLIIAGQDSVASIEAPELLVIHDLLSLIGNGRLERLELPGLHRVGAVQVRNDAALRVIVLAELAETDGLLVQDTAALETIAMPDLLHVFGDVYVQRNQALAVIEAPALTLVRGGLLVRDNPALPDLAGLAAVETIEGWVDILANPALLRVGLTSLVSAGNIFIGGTTLDGEDLGNHALTLVDLPALETAGSVFIGDNSALVELDMAALTYVSSFHIYRNVQLPTCQAEQVAAHLDGSVEDISILFTDDLGTCQ